MVKLKAITALISLSVSAFAQLPKNGGLTDNRPTYPSPEEAQYALVEPKLRTKWTGSVAANPESVWAEYPRPLLRRETWANLNGVWEFEKAGSRGDVNNIPTGRTLEQRILVPFCIESGLSGIAEQSKWSWYRRSFDVPNTFTENTVLHFAAVDYHATVFVNGQQVGTHQGGYDKFFFDVTQYLTSDKKNNELLVFVYDPTDGEGENIPIGKQRIIPSHIFYTPCSGIWQTVSIESAPSSEHITDIQLRAAADGSINTTITTTTESSTSPVTLSFLDPTDNSKVLSTHNSTLGGPITFKADIPDLKLWSTESPNLYNISVTVGTDTVITYTGFRTVERKEVNGIQRFVVNGKPVFNFGPLDQGYWPDGLHSPPSYEAMIFDLKYLKGLGMNFLRKHIKIEPDLFYYTADTIGLFLMQDMPALNIAGVNDTQQAEFERQLDIMIKQHLSFPSITSFVIYNEGWGQRNPGPEIYLAPRIHDLVAGHQLVNAVSGWNDNHQKDENIAVGDFHDNHHYSSPQCGTPFSSLASTPYDPRRIGFQGEFGGVGANTTIEHLWKDFEAIRDIPQTYELNLDVGTWNYRALRVIEELREQTRFFGHCNGGVYTQTTDVEGEVNGFLTYDRAIDRVDRPKWTKAIQDLYAAFEESLTDGGSWDPSQWGGGGEAQVHL
ncbi:glycoside hydrolase family 2 protein [Marasmius fiardii PR-910]|nr:glycoside hydrolase family 2 protein [Marasmius fiardii PR-910]